MLRCCVVIDLSYNVDRCFSFVKLTRTAPSLLLPSIWGFASTSGLQSQRTRHCRRMQARKHSHKLLCRVARHAKSSVHDLHVPKSPSQMMDDKYCLLLSRSTVRNKPVLVRRRCMAKQNDSEKVQAGPRWLQGTTRQHCHTCAQSCFVGDATPTPTLLSLFRAMIGWGLKNRPHLPVRTNEKSVRKKKLEPIDASSATNNSIAMRCCQDQTVSCSQTARFKGQRQHASKDCDVGSECFRFSALGQGLSSLCSSGLHGGFTVRSVGLKTVVFPFREFGIQCFGAGFGGRGSVAGLGCAGFSLGVRALCSGWAQDSGQAEIFPNCVTRCKLQHCPKLFKICRT